MSFTISPKNKDSEFMYFSSNVLAKLLKYIFENIVAICKLEDGEEIPVKIIDVLFRPRKGLALKVAIHKRPVICKELKIAIKPLSPTPIRDSLYVFRSRVLNGNIDLVKYLNKLIDLEIICPKCKISGLVKVNPDTGNILVYHKDNICVIGDIYENTEYVFNVLKLILLEFVDSILEEFRKNITEIEMIY